MKFINFLAGGILLTGAAISLHNSATNYGLATNTLHPSVASQSNGSSGDDTNGDSTSGDKVYHYNQFLFSPENTVTKKSDDNGVIKVDDKITVDRLEKNTYYKIEYTIRDCVNRENSFCDHSQQGPYVKSIKKADTTNGDGTN